MGQDLMVKLKNQIYELNKENRRLTEINEVHQELNGHLRREIQILENEVEELLKDIDCLSKEKDND